jgi:crossover junction endodeoxyribonuclease RuvC
MRILGFDPGLERLGYGIVDRVGSRVQCVTYGLISTPRIALPERLRLIYTETRQLIKEFEPTAVSTERLLFAANKTTAMDVSKALGVVLCCVGEFGLPWTEYSPPEIKLSVVGNGAASKEQVQFMVTKLLNLAETPKPDDIADALAIALTYALRTPPPR